MKFNTQQLTLLQTLEEKWEVWKKTNVCLFTQADKTKLDQVRAAFNLLPANIACHSCFVADFSVIMQAYDQQKQSGDTATQTAATGEPTTKAKRKK